MNFPVTLHKRWHGRRYNSYNRILKDTFDARVYKIGLRLDFTCPNRDGKVAVGGCIYCNNSSHTPQSYQPRASVTEQLERGAAAIQRRHRADKFIAYFQSYTNTYGSVSKLEKLYREALTAQTKILGPENPDAVHTMTDLANTLADERQFPAAIKLTKDALEIQRRTLGPEHPLTLQTLANLGWTLRQASQFAEAEKITREALATQRRVLGPEHPTTLSAQDNLANILQAQHRYAEAEPLSQQAYEIRRRVLGPEHPDTAASAYNLACLAALQGHRDAAFVLLQQAIDHGLSSTGLAGIEKDSDLKSLHADPRFPALVARAKQTSPASNK